jgi:hypothetical protein
MDLQEYWSVAQTELARQESAQEQLGTCSCAIGKQISAYASPHYSWCESPMSKSLRSRPIDLCLE